MGSRHLLLPALLMLLVAACQQVTTRSVEPGETRAGEVPIRMAGPGDAAVVVEVTINGAGPFEFVLDTGATLTCVDKALADELQLPDAKSFGGIGAIQGTAGGMSLVSIESLGIGEASAADLTACTIDLSQIQDAGLDVRGLLGLNFLKNYRVTLDFDRGRMMLDDPGAEQ
ncbi:MAG: retroviral-like aspartic protease family protein [Acidobacteria bacterium]|nr:retroviral-like aspartic protease family protein [Acidobacteriota bacterium]